MMLDRIAFLSERIGELEGQNRILQERISFLKGDRSTTIDHAEWVIQSLLDRFNDDPYIHDLDEVSDYLVQALAALGSVTHGDVEEKLDIDMVSDDARSYGPWHSSRNA